MAHHHHFRLSPGAVETIIGPLSVYFEEPIEIRISRYETIILTELMIQLLQSAR